MLQCYNVCQLKEWNIMFVYDTDKALSLNMLNCFFALSILLHRNTDLNR